MNGAASGDAGRDAGRGHGRVTVGLLHEGAQRLEQLAFSYPLKLIAPRRGRAAMSIVYVLSYGGGLVGGDAVTLDVHVQPNCRLALMTQGTTKVFRRRQRQWGGYIDSEPTTQTFTCTVDRGAALLLVPDPVQPFKDSHYIQRQEFRLADASASLVLLDWFTEGRATLDEVWAFHEFRSGNLLVQDGRIVLRDFMCLQPAYDDTLADMMGACRCYATLIVSGDHNSIAITRIMQRFRSLPRVKANRADTSATTETPQWTASLHNGIAVVKVAATSHEVCKELLYDIVENAGLIAQYGRDPFRALE